MKNHALHLPTSMLILAFGSFAREAALAGQGSGEMDRGGTSAAPHPQITYLLGQIPSDVAGWAPDQSLIKTACHPFRDCCICPNPDPQCPVDPGSCGFVLFRADAYDQAVAVMALVDAGELTAARKILNGLKRLLADTLSDHVDSLYIIEQGCGNPPSYTAIYPEPSALELTARNAWVLQAINYYESRTCDTQYAAMAENIARWIDGFRDMTPSACPTFGAVSMGVDSTVSSSAPSLGPVRIDYAEYLRRRIAGRLPAGEMGLVPYSKVYNAEANYVSSVALRQRSWLTKNLPLADQLTMGAQGSKDFVVDILWSANAPASLNPPPGPVRFFAGVDRSAGCTLDPDAYLDNQAWPNLAFGPYGPNREPFVDALQYVFNTMQRQGRGGCPDFATSLIDGFRPSEVSSSFVWLEGNEIMVSACAFTDDAGCANHYHQETAKAITPAGSCKDGVLYATDNLEGFEECQATASSSWYYDNEPAGMVRVFEYGRGVGSSLRAAKNKLSNAVVLSWVADLTCAGAGYNVYRSTLPTEVVRSDTLLGTQPTATGTSYSDPVLGSSTSYYYLIEVVNQP